MWLKCSEVTNHITPLPLCVLQNTVQQYSFSPNPKFLKVLFLNVLCTGKRRIQSLWGRKRGTIFSRKDTTYLPIMLYKYRQRRHLRTDDIGVPLRAVWVSGPGDFVFVVLYSIVVFHVDGFFFLDDCVPFTRSFCFVLWLNVSVQAITYKQSRCLILRYRFSKNLVYIDILYFVSLRVWIAYCVDCILFY